MSPAAPWSTIQRQRTQVILRQVRARERFDLDDDEVQLIGFVAEGLSNNEIGLKAIVMEAS